MEIKLACQHCESYAAVEDSHLYKLWENQYETEKEGLEEDFTVTVKVECVGCGQSSHYDTPIFRYIFRLMFDECR